MKDFLLCFLLFSSLILILPIHIDASIVGNCSLTPTVVMERPGTRFEITGRQITIYAIDHNGNLLSNISTTWSFDLLVERAKSSSNRQGEFVPTYVAPEPLFDPSFLFPSSKRNVNDIFDSFDPEYPWMVDPLEPRVEGQPCSSDRTSPCGEILQYIWIMEMDCWVEHVTRPFKGFERESVFVHFSHPSHPLFRITSEHHLINGYLEYNGNNTGIQAHYKYRYGSNNNFKSLFSSSFHILNWLHFQYHTHPHSPSCYKVQTH
jgi:hypothetical protein